MGRYPPGNRAADAITGLNSRDPLEQPLTSLDTRAADPHFFREDVFDGEGFSHKVIVGGPRGVAVSTIHNDGTFTVTDEATGQVTYRADMTRI